MQRANITYGNLSLLASKWQLLNASTMYRSWNTKTHIHLARISGRDFSLGGMCLEKWSFSFSRFHERIGMCSVACSPPPPTPKKSYGRGGGILGLGCNDLDCYTLHSVKHPFISPYHQPFVKSQATIPGFRHCTQ